MNSENARMPLSVGTPQVPAERAYQGCVETLVRIEESKLNACTRGNLQHYSDCWTRDEPSFNKAMAGCYATYTAAMKGKPPPPPSVNPSPFL
jgi:hypothetical protein